MEAKVSEGATPHPAKICNELSFDPVCPMGSA